MSQGHGGVMEKTKNRNALLFKALRFWLKRKKVETLEIAIIGIFT